MSNELSAFRRSWKKLNMFNFFQLCRKDDFTKNSFDPFHCCQKTATMSKGRYFTINLFVGSQRDWEVCLVIHMMNVWSCWISTAYNIVESGSISLCAIKLYLALFVSTGTSSSNCAWVPLVVIPTKCINIIAAAQLDSAFSLNVLPIYGTACLLIELVLPLCLRSKIPWKLLICCH